MPMRALPWMERSRIPPQPPLRRRRPPPQFLPIPPPRTPRRTRPRRPHPRSRVSLKPRRPERARLGIVGVCCGPVGAVADACHVPAIITCVEVVVAHGVLC